MDLELLKQRKIDEIKCAPVIAFFKEELENLKADYDSILSKESRMEFDIRLKIYDSIALILIELPVDDWNEDSVADVKLRLQALLKSTSFTNISLLNTDRFIIKVVRVVPFELVKRSSMSYAESIPKRT